MPLSYEFREAQMADKVAKILLFVAKFSKKQAFIKFGDASIGVIWGGSPKTYYIHAEYRHPDMFKTKPQHVGIDHCTIVQVDPTILGRTLRGNSQTRGITLNIIRPNRIQVIVNDSTDRVITHSIPCDLKTRDEYELMLIETIEHRLCSYNTKSYVDSINQFKYVIDSIVRLGTQRVYIQSKQTNATNCLKIVSKNEGSIIDVYLNELESDRSSEPDSPSRDEFDNDLDVSIVPYKRDSAGVQIDTKKLALFLSGLLVTKEQTKEKKAKICLDIEHNKCLKITLDYEIPQMEKMHQSLLLLHSLNN